MNKDVFLNVPDGWKIEPLALDDTPVHFDRILARSKGMKQVLNRLLAAARADLPVLILGETGTGKDLVAESIHLRSKRKAGPYVAMNAGAIPKELLASELFGHVAGAFTGALSRRQGRLSRADGGTLFLDEIDSMDLSVQATLLRVLEDGRFEPVGGDVSRRVDVRIIAASNVDLEGLVKAGQFRQDLYWRLEGFLLRLPALRERPGAVLFLALEFLREFNAAHGLKVKGIAPAAARILESYPWPGNVRELKNVVQSAALLAQEKDIQPSHLPQRLGQAQAELPEFRFPLGDSLRALERAYLLKTLALVAGNKSAAAAKLGISRKALYAKLKRRG